MTFEFRHDEKEIKFLIMSENNTMLLLLLHSLVISLFRIVQEKTDDRGDKRGTLLEKADSAVPDESVASDGGAASGSDGKGGQKRKRDDKTVANSTQDKSEVGLNCHHVMCYRLTLHNYAFNKQTNTNPTG